jgi:hypothetical protein
MAGVKVTDLTALPTADPTDVMYIVDTSSNTSKQIEVQNIYDGMPQFESGSFTPVFTNETNTPSVLNSIGGQYTRVNDTVIMTFRLAVTMDAGFNNTDFNFSLPIASNFANAFELLGTHNKPAFLDQASIFADTTNNLGICAIKTGSNGDAISAITIMVQYQII